MISIANFAHKYCHITKHFTGHSCVVARSNEAHRSSLRHRLNSIKVLNDLVKALNEFQLPAFDLNDEQRHDFIICIGFVFSQYFKKIQIIIFELVTQLTMGARYLL